MIAPTIAPQPPDLGRNVPSPSETPHQWGLWPGVAISAAIALIAMRAGAIDWLATHGAGPLTVAIVLGMLAGNTVYGRFVSTAGAGVRF